MLYLFADCAAIFDDAISLLCRYLIAYDLRENMNVPVTPPSFPSSVSVSNCYDLNLYYSKY